MPAPRAFRHNFGHVVPHASPPPDQLARIAEFSHTDLTLAGQVGSDAARTSWLHGNLRVTISRLTILEYLDRSGSSPFADWFATLDATAAAKVTIATRRLELGNFSNFKGVRGGVFEYRVDFGPGYRVYFGKDGESIVILLGGGTKKRQDRDIASAHERWADYKKRKAQEK